MNEHDHVIIGYGEVGTSLSEVLQEHYEVFVHDPEKKLILTPSEYAGCVLHICIPYSSSFYKHVKLYQKEFLPAITIVHSTVPVGTCDKLDVVHSPVRGKHPHLAEGIKTFVKYFGGKDAKDAAHIFERIGISAYCTKKARTTEALKLWDTTQYGILIMLNKRIHQWCEENDVDFDIVYTEANKTYNAGYSKLGTPNVVRPYLEYMEGEIGGHCIRPNAEMLGEEL